MPSQRLEIKVDALEDRVSELERLPARVEELGSQVAQLRGEMRAEFSAIRGEGAESVSLAQLRDELRAIRGPGGEGPSLVELRQEIRDGDEETRRLMRVLHEDLVGRIALLGEGRPRRRKSGADRS